MMFLPNFPHSAHLQPIWWSSEAIYFWNLSDYKPELKIKVSVIEENNFSYFYVESISCMIRLMQKVINAKTHCVHTVRTYVRVRSGEKREILSHRKNISWNQLFSDFFSKTVDFTKYLSKECETKFP